MIPCRIRRLPFHSGDSPVTADSGITIGLLLGKEAVLAKHCPQHLVQYVWQPGETNVARNDQYRFGLLHTLDRIEQIFTSPANPEQEITLGLQKLRVPRVPPRRGTRGCAQCGDAP